MNNANKAQAKPGVSDAQILANQNARIWIRFFVRVTVIAIASALLVQNVPIVAANRSVLDALGGVIALWPLWTQLGQNYAERTRRGRLCFDQNNAPDAQILLAPFASPRVSRLFDVTGEGTYFLASALHATGDITRAEGLHRQNSRPSVWGEKSQAFLSNTESPV